MLSLKSRKMRIFCFVFIMCSVLGSLSSCSRTEINLPVAIPPVNSENKLIDRNTLVNPVVDIEGQAIKDACIIYRGGYFYIFSSCFYFEDGMERCHILGLRAEKLDGEYETLFCTYGSELGVYGLASPDISEYDGKYYLSYNSWGDKPGEANRLFYAVSQDLVNWDFHKPLAPKATEGVRAIDAALAFANDKVYLCWKEKQSIKFAFADSIEAEEWTRIPAKMGGWYENVQFISIDNSWYIMATGYDYIFRHRPYLLAMDGDSASDESWGKWKKSHKLEIPEEEFNTKERANAAYLLDARENDGVFYLLYAGTVNQSLHAKRGDCRLGIAWSKDLIKWEIK